MTHFSRRHKSKAAALFSLIAALTAASAFAQTGGEWTHLTATPANKVGAERWVQPLRGELFRLEPTLLRNRLQTAARGEPSAAKASGQQVQLPMPDGTLARFAIVEAPVMEDGLAAKFPEIKTYAGQGIDDPSATVRMDISPLGFHAQILSPTGAVYVDPAYRNDATLHVSYFKRDLVNASEWHCLGDLGKDVEHRAGSETGEVANKVQSGANLRTFRLAVACTGEYAAFYGGTVSNAMAGIVSAVNRVDGVYEAELAVRLVLVTNNYLLVFTNSATDPYSNISDGATLATNQVVIDNIIGPANYDIGHVFGTDLGGVALRPAVCQSWKAGGTTGLPNPTGDAFWIDFVAHEIGHQFGANHTFNSTNLNCSGGTRNADTAMEPGSGSTIMAYAGICFPDNLQPHSDPYFHGVSLDQIQSYLAGGGGCAVSTSTGNAAPTVSVVGPTNYTIPASTPFVLTATGSDSNGDPLTYCWEEMDAGSPTPDLTSPDNGSMALFRTFQPTNVPFRFFPNLPSILANTSGNQEKLPTTSRTNKFRVTARDNRSGGGGVSDAQMQVTSVAGTGPFVVTSPNTAVSWSGARTVTWNVAGSASAPINASGVNIYLSTNGGNAFQFLLATNVPNNGSASVVLPNVTSTQARIKVEGSGNIFFDISDANFSITPGGPIIQIAGTSLVSESCPPTNGVIDPYETVTVSWALTNSGTASTTNLVATLLTSNGVYYPSAPQNYGAIPVGGTVTQAFSFTPAGVCGGAVSALLKLSDGAADLGTLVQNFTLGGAQSTVVTQVFASAGTVTIPTGGKASLYPSTIVVSGVTNPVAKVTVNFPSMWHTFASDIGMLLVGPGSQTVVLMFQCGDTLNGTILSNANITFDDTAATFLPNGSDPSANYGSGTYQPTWEWEPSGDYPSPAPPAPATNSNYYGTNLSSLATSPNGTWSLYVYDWLDVGGDVPGALTNGWKLNFISTNTAAACCSTFPAPTLTSTTYSNSVVLFNWSAMPGPHYQVQYSTNLATGPWINLGSSILGTNTTMGISDNVGSAPMRFYRVLVGP